MVQENENNGNEVENQMPSKFEEFYKRVGKGTCIAFHWASQGQTTLLYLSKTTLDPLSDRDREQNIRTSIQWLQAWIRRQQDSKNKKWLNRVKG